MSLLAFGGCHQKKKKKENKLEKKTQATIFDELSYLHTHVADAPEGRGQGGGAPTRGGGVVCELAVTENNRRPSRYT